MSSGKYDKVMKFLIGQPAKTFDYVISTSKPDQRTRPRVKDLLTGIAPLSVPVEKPKTKHWFKKTNVPAIPGFYEAGLKDSYLSRIVHKIFPAAPKGKFASVSEYVSRFSAYDGLNTPIPNPDQLTLEHLCHRSSETLPPPINNVVGLENFVKSIVISILFGNDDNKLLNLTAYPKKEVENIYEVYPFDLEYAFHDNNTLSDKGLWDIEKIKALILGKDNADKTKDIGVAAALLDTLGNFGETSTSFYRYEQGGIKELKNRTSRNSIYDTYYKPTFMRCLEAELEAKNSNHSLALLDIFTELLEQIKLHQEDSYIKTCLDGISKFNSSKKHRDYLQPTMGKYKDKLTQSIEHFSTCITHIREEILLETPHSIGVGPGVASAFAALPPCCGGGSGASGRAEETDAYIFKHTPSSEIESPGLALDEPTKKNTTAFSSGFPRASSFTQTVESSAHEGSYMGK